MRKKLKFHQFVMPSMALISAFLIVIFGVNICLNIYISRETDKHIRNMFSSFNLYMKDPAYWDEAYKDEDGDFLIKTEYVMFDENKACVDASPLVSNDVKNNKVDAWINYYHSHHNQVVNKKKLTVNIDDTIYHASAKKFYGYYDGYMLFEPNKTNDNHTYTILVYSDITSIVNFVDFFNRMLIIFTLVSMGFSIFIMLYTAKKVSGSFIKLKEYIYHVGKREPLGKVSLPYDEFNDVLHTIRAMSDMLDEAEMSKKKFFQNASHELRTPLMSIQGYAEAIKKGINSTENSIEIILKESEKMSKLVDDILTLSKIERTTFELNLEETDINELLYSSAWSIKSRTDECGLTLKLNIPSERILLKVDETLIERAVLNLLTNAIRYAKSWVQVELINHEKYICIKVTDDGAQITQEEITHIFERFYNGKQGNFGIGLSLTKEIIERHQGTIKAKALGDKTEFMIKLFRNFATN